MNELNPNIESMKMSNVNPTFAEVTDVVNTIQYLITSKFRDYRAIPDTSEEDWRLETIDLLKKISEKTREYDLMRVDYVQSEPVPFKKIYPDMSDKDYQDLIRPISEDIKERDMLREIQCKYMTNEQADRLQELESLCEQLISKGF